MDKYYKGTVAMKLKLGFLKTKWESDGTYSFKRFCSPFSVQFSKYYMLGDEALLILVYQSREIKII